MQITSRRTGAVLNTKQQDSELTWNAGDTRCPECTHVHGFNVYHRETVGKSPFGLGCLAPWRRRPNYDRRNILTSMSKPSPRPLGIVQVS